jgi:hypothetical protein
MTELSGALDGIGLQPLLGFLGGLNQSGHLTLEDEHWAGTLALADGQIVGATFGPEHGLDALDAIFFALQHGRFRFSASESCEVNLVMDPAALAEHLAALGREVAELASVVPSLGAVPRVVDSTEAGQVTLGRGALRLLLVLDGRRTVAEHARDRNLLTTLRELAELTRLGLVTTEPVRNGVAAHDAAAVAPAAEPTQPAAGRSASSELQARAAEHRRRGVERSPGEAQSTQTKAPGPLGRRFWR